MKKYSVLFLIVLLIACGTEKKNETDNSQQLDVDYILPEVGGEIAEEEYTGGPTELERRYISIDNSKYKPGEMPAPKCGVNLDGIEVSTQVMNGAINFITVTTPQPVTRFFIGIKGVPGYLVYVPENSVEAIEDPDAIMDKSGRKPTHVPDGPESGYYTYVIPMMMAQEYSGECDLIISAELADGCITNRSEFHLKEIETRAGALDVKLSFSNSKDVDLHLFTPSGRHIYFSSSRHGQYIEGGKIYEFGLDIDSNAGCRIDGINKENIYIPEEYIEPGVYKVGVVLYGNCNPDIATSWSVVARYNGNPITPLSGQNPATGIFPVGAPSERDATIVMTFRLQ